MRGSFRSVVAFCLGTGALTLPAVAASFSVGGGTITTTQADNSVDNTGASGGFELQANTTGNNDAVTITNVTINNAGGRSLDVGGNLASSGPYSVIMHGSTLGGGAGGWFQSVSGLVSLDTTGGTANSMSGVLALTVFTVTGNGAVALNLGADNITSTLEAVQIGAAQGTISFDMAGTTVTSTGLYGVVAQNGNGNITIGGLNGGLSGSITANSGYGIYTSSNGNTSITIASSGSITALDGIFIGSTVSSIDNFGTLAAANNAITGSFGPLSVTLEAGSTTSGRLLGGNSSDVFTIFTGANISGATFDGNGGNDALILTGTGTANLDLSTVSHIQDLQKNQAGTWTVLGTGTLPSVTVNAGTLKAGSTTALNSGTSLTMNGGIFDLNGNDVSVGQLAGTGGTIALGAKALSVTMANLDQTVASTITGTGSLTKSGVATLTLSGNNTYSGGTTLISRSLVLGTSSAAGTGPITVAGSALSSLEYANGVTIANPIVLAGGSPQLTVSSGTATQSGVISGSGLEKIGTGTLIFSGNNSYAGGTTITAGTLQLGDGSIGGIGKVGSGNVDNNGTLAANLGLVSTVLLDNLISGSGNLTKSGVGTLILGGNNTYSGTTTLNGGTIVVGNGASGTLGTGDVVNNGALAFNRSNAFTLTNNISGTGGITDNGFGLLIITGANTYSGQTISNGGGIQVGAGGTTGSLGTGDVVLGGLASLTFNRSNDINFGGNITGNGSLTQAGSGTLILTGANGYTGPTTINSGGTLQVGSGGTNGTLGSGSVVDNGTLNFNHSDNISVSNIVSGSGALGQIGTGTLTLTGANSYTGGTTIAAGTLKLGSGGALSNAGALTINGGTFDLNGHSQTVGPLSGSGGTIIGNQGFLTTNSNVNTTLAASIVGADQLTKTGNGTLTLTGSSDFFADPGILISAGAVQIGNGGTSGSVAGNITANGTLIFNRSDTATYAGRINGSGTVLQVGPGTTILTGFSNQFTGTTMISAGTLQIGNNTSGPYLSGNFVNNSNLALDLVGPGAITGVISGTGTVVVIGGTNTLAAANSYTGGTVVNGGALQLGAGGSLPSTGSLTVNGGTFSLNGRNQTIGALSGNGGFIALTNAALTTNSAADTVLASQFTSIFNAGSLNKEGIGKLTLTGDNFVGSGITVLAGTLQIGNGGTTGSLQGRIANSGTLVFNRSDASSFGDIISGSGSVIKAGGGTLTLFATNTYTGATAVRAGALSVNGSIASSAVTVASGATLNGTGMVGATTIQNGATLAPGNSIGTLTVNGNLTLASGAIYNVEVSPTAADRTNVGGSASLNGTVATSVASGTYSFGQRFTLLNAAGGVSGSFSSLTGIPISLKGQLSYDANNAYLTLSPNALAPLLSSPTGNQQKVVAAIDAAVKAGNVPPAGFVPLYSLSGPALNSALDQISGRATPNIINAVGQGFLSFMSMTASGGSSETGNFAPGSAYGSADAHRAQLGTGEMRVWAAVYGGHVGLSGDSASGAAGLSSNNVGLIGGADKRLTDWLMAGVTLGLGQQQFHSGNGTGDSNDYMIGLYGRAEAGPAYLAASFGYGWHQIKTLRVVTVSGTDVLQGKENADDVGGRVEAGWRLPLDETTSVVPYGAFAGESFASPAFAETALSGASTFALSYAAQTTGLGRSELGAHLDRRYALDHGILTADVRTAWAHQLDDLPFTQASFISLPGAAFQTVGVRPGRDTALLGLDLEIQNNSGLFFGLKGESQLGAGTTVLEGMGNFGWRW